MASPANQRLGQYYIVSQGDESILHITLVKLFSERAPIDGATRSAIIFVLMNPAYDEDEQFWFHAWKTALHYFHVLNEFTDLRIRIAKTDKAQIGALEHLGFVASNLPGEYVGNLRSWTML